MSSISGLLNFIDLYSIVYTCHMQQDIRLSISEAARIFGVNPQTIRRAIKSGGISYIVVRNRYRLSFSSLLKWSQKQTTTRNKLAKHGIGQFVQSWAINNKHFAPHPENVRKQVPTS